MFVFYLIFLNPFNVVIKSKCRIHFSVFILALTLNDFSVVDKLPLSVLLIQCTDFDTSAHEGILPSVNH